MKNKFRPLILFLMFCAVFAACSNNNLPSETSTSVTSVHIESSLTSNPILADSTQTLLGGLTEMDVKPDKQKLLFWETSDTYRGRCDSFVDDEGTNYRFIKETGEYIGFFKPGTKATGPKISEREARIIADATAAMFVDVLRYTHHECQVRGGYPEEGLFQIDSYNFSYSRTLSGYETIEGASVTMREDGTVMAVYLDNIGKFDGLAEPKIDKKEMEARFFAEVKKKFGVDAVVVLVYGQVLDYENSQFFMRYDFELEVQLGGHGRQQVMVPVL